ncbi:MAG: sarcosine oxidase subunit gamma family protein [Rhizobiaceae bacterium]
MPKKIETNKMEDFHAVTPLQGATIAGTGVNICVREGLAIAQLFAKSGQGAKVERLLKIKGVPSVASSVNDVIALPLSPDQWLLISEKETNDNLSKRIGKKISKYGHVSEQSDGRVCIRISGLKARELMARGCRLDLHPSVTQSGFCAQTIMAQVGVIVHQVDEDPTYDLYVLSGFAHSFWHWLNQTSEQFNSSSPSVSR